MIAIKVGDLMTALMGPDGGGGSLEDQITLVLVKKGVISCENETQCDDNKQVEFCWKKCQTNGIYSVSVARRWYVPLSKSLRKRRDYPVSIKFSFHALHWLKPGAQCPSLSALPRSTNQIASVRKISLAMAQNPVYQKVSMWRPTR